MCLGLSSFKTDCRWFALWKEVLLGSTPKWGQRVREETLNWDESQGLNRDKGEDGECWSENGLQSYPTLRRKSWIYSFTMTDHLVRAVSWRSCHFGYSSGSLQQMVLPKERPSCMKSICPSTLAVWWWREYGQCTPAPTKLCQVQDISSDLLEDSLNYV